MPTEVQTAAFKLKNGEFSSVIESTSASTGATSYYIVEMVKSSEKGSDMNKYKKNLKMSLKLKKNKIQPLSAELLLSTLKRIMSL